MKFFIKTILLLLIVSSSIVFASQEQDVEMDNDLFEAIASGKLQGVKSAMANVKDINNYPSINNPLISATIFEKYDIVKYLIEQGANVNSKNQVDESPLYIAARYNRPDLVRLLVENGANVNDPDRYGNTPLTLSPTREISNLMNPYDQNANLIKAVQAENIAAIKDALAKQADINTTTATSGNWQANTPLHIAACKNNVEIVKFLLDNGANIDVVKADGRQTPFQEAVACDAYDVVKLLYNRGADVELKKGDNTPLHSAAMSDRPEMVDLLLQLGADYNKQRPPTNETALQLAQSQLYWSEYKDPVKKAAKEKIIDLLINAPNMETKAELINTLSGYEIPNDVVDIIADYYYKPRKI